MSRHSRPGGPYVTPIKSDGTNAVEAGDRGKFTLESSTTYYAPIGDPDAGLQSAHIQWDAAIVLTSITVECCDFADDEATNISSIAGDWIPQDGAKSFIADDVPVVGAGATVANGVIAVAGGAAGGGFFHMGGNGAKRTRLKIVVGGTGGALRVGAHGKD